MNLRSLSEKQFAEIIGRPVEDVRSFVREGMPPNPDGTLDLVACIAWKLKKPSLLPSRSNPLAFAKDWLQDILADGGMPAREVLKAAQAEDISERTLDRAKKILGIVSKKGSQSGGWIWELPPSEGNSSPKSAK